MMIELSGLSKSFGVVRAVDGLSFGVRAGTVTGFLGPNGSGKTTTLRMLLGLVRPTSGRALIGGRGYAELEHPVRTVGAALDAEGFHPARTARDHLRMFCRAAELPMSRVGAVLELTGLTGPADRRVDTFSLGMRQRLSLATALLGDPRVLILDEPANGLDPEGIRWLRELLRHLAGNGCAVLMSSHVLTEVERTVDHVVLVHRGRLVKDAPLSELTGGGEQRVRTEHPGELARALESAGGIVRREPDHLVVSGMAPAAIGRAALDARAVLIELTEEKSDLESLFLDLTVAAAEAVRP